MFSLTLSYMAGGGLGHRKYECPEKRNYTASIICRVCGNAGHMARDCRERAKGVDWRNHDPAAAPGDAVDAEYDVRFPSLILLIYLGTNTGILV